MTFLGYDTNPYKYVAKSDLFVCASFAEGFSTAATEALILATPVCTVDVSGMKELLGEDNEWGLVTENDENALYEGIRRLLDDRAALLTVYGYPADYLELTYTCPDCKDTGFIGQEKCHCFKQAIIDFLYEQANLGHILKQENFNHFRFDYYADGPKDPYLGLTPRENIERIVRDCQKFIASFEDSYDNILVYGNTGVGKTFLINCIAKEILDMSYPVVYLTSFQFFDIMEKHTFSRSLEEKTEATHQFEHIFDCDLLIIDDLGTEFTNNFVSSELYDILNTRMREGKSTIISTNLSLKELKDA